MKSSTIITVRKKNERLKQQQKQKWHWQQQKIGLAAIIKSRHKKCQQEQQ
jgi:hypothetical protein